MSSKQSRQNIICQVLGKADYIWLAVEELEQHIPLSLVNSDTFGIAE